MIFHNGRSISLILLMLAAPLRSEDYLAPAPVNFTTEYVEIDNKIWCIKNQNNRVTFHEDDSWMRGVEVRYLRRYFSGDLGRNDEDGNVRPPQDNILDTGCLWGCAAVLILGSGFWIGVWVFLRWLD